MRGNKGVSAIIIILLVMAIGTVVYEGIYGAYLINNNFILRRSARETAIIKGVNAMEFLKLSMQEAVSYAFHQAAYETLKKGGYYKFPADVPTIDSVPYWIEYGNTYVPNLKANLTNATLELFDEYCDNYVESYNRELKIYFEKPDYYPSTRCGKIEMTASGRTVQLKIEDKCDYGLRMIGRFFTIYESNANFVDTVDSNALQLFETAKSIFIDVEKNPILEAVENAIAEMPSEPPENWDEQLKNKIKTKISEKETEINSGLSDMIISFSFGDSDINVNYCEECETKYKANILVKVNVDSDSSNPENCYPIYSIKHEDNCVESSNDLNWRYLSLEFYIHDGLWKEI